MNDFVQLRVAFADRHFPLRSGGLFKHRTGCRATTPHRLIPMAHAARTVGVLVAETHFITRRLLHFDVRPIGLQLISDNHGQTGAHALAHFRTVAHNGDGAVGGDADVDLRIINPAVGHAIGAELFRFVFGQRILPAPTRRQYQCTGGADAFEKTTTAEIAQGEIIRKTAHAFASFKCVDA